MDRDEKFGTELNGTRDISIYELISRTNETEALIPVSHHTAFHKVSRKVTK